MKGRYGEEGLGMAQLVVPAGLGDWEGNSPSG